MADLAMIQTLQRAERLMTAVVRAFYEDPYIVVVDALIREKYLKDKEEELGARVNLRHKQVRAVLAALEREGLVQQESISDVIGGTRMSNYWYIDYRRAVDSIRLRIYLMQKRLKDMESKALLDTTYECPQCQATYDLLAVQQLRNAANSFCCSHCCDQDEHSLCGPAPYMLVDQNNRGRLEAFECGRHELNEQLRRSTSADCPREGIFELLSELRDAAVPSTLPSELRARGVGGGFGHGAVQHARFRDGSEVAYGQGGGAAGGGGGGGGGAAAGGNGGRGGGAGPSVSGQRMEVLYAHNAAGQEIVVEIEEDSDAEEERDEALVGVLPNNALRKRKAELAKAEQAAAAVKKIKVAPQFLLGSRISGGAAAAAGVAANGGGVGGGNGEDGDGDSDGSSSGSDGEGGDDEFGGGGASHDVSLDSEGGAEPVILQRRGDVVVLRPVSAVLPPEVRMERFRRQYLKEYSLLKAKASEAAAAKAAAARTAVAVSTATAARDGDDAEEWESGSSGGKASPRGRSGRACPANGGSSPNGFASGRGSSSPGGGGGGSGECGGASSGIWLDLGGRRVRAEALSEDALAKLSPEEYARLYELLREQEQGADTPAAAVSFIAGDRHR